MILKVRILDDAAKIKEERKYWKYFFNINELEVEKVTASDFEELSENYFPEKKYDDETSQQMFYVNTDTYDLLKDDKLSSKPFEKYDEYFKKLNYSFAQVGFSIERKIPHHEGTLLNDKIYYKNTYQILTEGEVYLMNDEGKTIEKLN